MQSCLRWISIQSLISKLNVLQRSRDEAGRIAANVAKLPEGEQVLAPDGTIRLPERLNCDQLSSRWKLLHAVEDNLCYLGRLRA